MVGALEIRRLRQAAADALGSGFDVRAFHDAVLDSGSVTLPMLRERVGAFIDERRRAASAPPPARALSAPARRSS